MDTTTQHPLAIARIEAGLTRTELAAGVLIAESTLGRWETGERTPSRAHQRLIARRLRIPEPVVNSWWAA